MSMVGGPSLLTKAERLMRRTVAGATLTAVVGFSILTASPASALSFPMFDTCDAAAAAGIYNIPSDDPRYLPKLDSNGNGIACENPNYAFIPLPPMPTMGSTPGPDTQVEQLPVGGADTGVTVTPRGSGNALAALALAGLAALAGGVMTVRSRGARL